MTESLVHRGPDDRGEALFQTDWGRVGLGHRRLAIIDLTTAGHQPMQLSSPQLSIIFNGELYNFRDVRRQLEHRSWSFESDSDTEVLLKSFAEFGPGCVDQFIGMFAFAALDRDNGFLYLCRDRAGVKPLFYFWDGRTLLFSSELKALHEAPMFRPVVNPDSLALYLR